MPKLTKRLNIYKRTAKTKRVYDDGFKDEYVNLALGMCLFGATIADIAEKLGCEPDTIHRWCFAHPKLQQAIDFGRDQVDGQVAEALVQRALGFTYEAVKLWCHEGEVIEHTYEEYVPPDPQAARFWLTNRRPDKFSNREVTELSGPGGKPIQVDNISAREHLERKLAGLSDRVLIEERPGAPKSADR